MLADIAFAAARVANRLPRGGYFITRTLPRIIPGLRNYPIPTKYGPVICDLREWVCWPLVKFGEYPHWHDDEAILPSLGLTKDSVVLDVGANLGVTVLQFARLAGRVHAFEPAPRALHFLRQNVGHLPNVTVHAIALGSEAGTATFSEEWKLDESHFAETGIEVPVQTIDGLALNPDFIKIDVEGFEHLVLSGASATLKAGPTVLFEALDPAALEASSQIILAVNPDYKIEHVGGESFNYIARV
jgi:FkbM family methyltransferase